MADEKAAIFGKLALGLCVGGLILWIVVGILSLCTRSWTGRDAANVLMAGEVAAFFVACLGRRSGVGASAMVISGVIALGCFVSH